MFYFSFSCRYYQQNRNEYHPGAGAGAATGAGAYDRNEYRQNYQGNGYDNRNPAYFNAMKGSNRGSGSGSGAGYGNRDGYESYYDGI